jgi:NADH:ubiquinone oxidoreductase subunit 3 (subunit A)
MNTLLTLFLIVPILVIILLLLNKFFAPHFEYVEKVQPYECGFDPIYGQTRAQFQIHFFLVAMLFLVFDLEILLLFPIAVTIYQVSFYGFSICLIFFIILVIGFILEIGTGAINLTDFKTGLPLKTQSERKQHENY